MPRSSAARVRLKSLRANASRIATTSAFCSGPSRSSSDRPDGGRANGGPSADPGDATPLRGVEFLDEGVDQQEDVLVPCSKGRGFFSKPIDKGEFLAKVEDILSARLG